jgi:hypothetical protein
MRASRQLSHDFCLDLDRGSVTELRQVASLPSFAQRLHACCLRASPLPTGCSIACNAAVVVVAIVAAVAAVAVTIDVVVVGTSWLSHLTCASLHALHVPLNRVVLITQSL